MHTIECITIRFQADGILEQQKCHTHGSHWQLVSLIKFLVKKPDFVCMHTICTPQFGACILYMGACKFYSDIETLTFSAQFYRLLPNYSQFTILFHPSPFLDRNSKVLFSVGLKFIFKCAQCAQCAPSVHVLAPRCIVGPIIEPAKQPSSSNEFQNSYLTQISPSTQT